jgi:DsbC/DsbD-like thiol-disulfide interchange protein/cytochrome c biogenesis protein CcdA
VPLHLFSLLLFLCLLAFPAGARESAPVRSDNITARIMADQATATPGGTVTLAFVQEIREGWHTYWRNPGDSGAPANLAWILAEGSRIGEPLWPAPEAIPYFGLMTYGHHDRFVLLHELTLPADWPQGTPFPIRLEADWLVCAEICIPEDGSFALDLATGPASDPADPAFRGLIETARAELPSPSPWTTRFNATSVSEDGATLRLAAALDIELEGLSEARFFPHTQGLIDQVADQPWTRAADGLVVDMALDWPEALDETLEGVLVLTEDLPDGPLRQAFIVEAGRDATLAIGAMGGAIGTSGLASLGGGAGPGLVELAFLALIGGLLLNLMPCVFPVLSIKALSLVHHAGSRSTITHGLSYTAGVLATFLALAGLLIALQATGALIGWGFQLQEPLVVAFLAYLMFVIGIWLFGGLEFGMGRLTGIGQDLTRSRGLGGSFATGVLAVFVASPCTAPFMAGAIGFALTLDAPTALAVFAALGLGLALPYLALSMSPWAQRRLPRPGPWMVRFRQFMAFPMFATAAWLVWVLARQAGDTALLLVLLGFVAIGLALWAFRLDGRVAKSAGIACLVLALGLGVLPGQLPAAGPGDAAAGPGGYRISFEGPAEPFSETRLAELRREGRPVLVNMTAAWCLTCLVNEGNALSGETFKAALARNDAAYLKGDWTRRDPAITTYLKSFERAGVPLYVVYPATGEPTLLPQLLTEGMVQDALDRAGAVSTDNLMRL